MLYGINYTYYSVKTVKICFHVPFNCACSATSYTIIMYDIIIKNIPGSVTNHSLIVVFLK